MTLRTQKVKKDILYIYITQTIPLKATGSIKPFCPHLLDTILSPGCKIILAIRTDITIIFSWPRASNKYLAGPLGQPKISCGQRPPMICCGLGPQLTISCIGIYVLFKSSTGPLGPVINIWLDLWASQRSLRTILDLIIS